VGFAGSVSPSFTFPTIVGRIRGKHYRHLSSEGEQKDVFVGDEVTIRYPIFESIGYPLVDRSAVKSWEDLEHVWCYAFYSKLKISTESHPVLLTEALCTPKVILKGFLSPPYHFYKY